MTLAKKGKAQTVNIESGLEIAPRIFRIFQARVPIIGYVGLSPQKHNTSGGFQFLGNMLESVIQIMEDSKTLERTDVFAMVVECVSNKLAELVSELVYIPVIVLRAEKAVHGQVAVAYDLLVMEQQAPTKFVKQFMSV